MNKVDRALAETIRWEDDPDGFDQRLHALGQNFDEFIVVNPRFDPWMLDYIDTEQFSSDKCLVWHINNTWIVKKFKKSWTIEKGWDLISCELDITPTVEYNPDLSFLSFDIDTTVEFDDAIYEHVYYLDPKFDHDGINPWVAKIKYPDIEIQGTKNRGTIEPAKSNFDVVFISYNEPNAEANWQRLLEKCPHAKRVKNVTGIFEAHKQAAKIATTSMFYVVDGDAELVDDWRFDFKPNAFDMDCVHLWTSINPINDLEYGYGGVKLFPRQLLLNALTWNIDLTTGLGKLKLINKISNVTAFNYDPFTTWRSAFRECVKLSSSLDPDALERLEIWCTVGVDRENGMYAIDGARLGRKYGLDNLNNPDKLKLINNYDWMTHEFNEFYKPRQY